ncbi:hypothetical protein K505DRAFT_333469 [Melanomma pulvis-pyrius CBS 109.77]|uniref:Myb-like domain-containing protein n=1 Tax=Melanomma pulvis-pyrius CBS 109.77 TaxID=1314802 RepID=A0A6A6XQ98_9PLEO|nr:hypothetical protein K505DRAFT_333469 [Melanomma pulvis-pyrius CBS 109.77]
MPMNWTPENDRLLLLKLVETHNLSVQYEAIAKAWPDGGTKPTARAISERFVKLRQLAGISAPKKVLGVSRTTPKVSTPSSSARKRKGTKKRLEGDETDADEHLTPPEDDAPSPTPKSRKLTAAHTPKKSTPRFGERFSNYNGISTGSPSSTKIKNEPIEDPFQTSAFSELLARDAAAASTLNANVNGDTFNSGLGYSDYGRPIPRGSGRETSVNNSLGGMNSVTGFSAFDGIEDMASGMDLGGNHITDLNGFSIGTGTGTGLTAPFELPSSHSSNTVSGNVSGNGMSFSQHPMSSPMGHSMAADAGNLSLDSSISFNHRGGALPVTPKKGATNKTTSSTTKLSQMPMGSMPAHRVVKPVEEPLSQERRQRTPRPASKHAQQSIAERLQAQRQADLEDGEKSSQDDSAESEFENSDEDSGGFSDGRSLFSTNIGAEQYVRS